MPPTMTSASSRAPSALSGCGREVMAFGGGQEIEYVVMYSVQP